MTRDVLICSTTRMALVPAARQTVYRLADPAYGPLNPRQRPVSRTADRATWNRFDLAGERTLYAASNPEGAYAELVQPLKRPVPVLANELFDDAGDVDAVDDLITEDWSAAGMPLAPYVLNVDWLYRFRLYTMLLPAQGWLVDAEHSSTVGYLNRHLPLALHTRGQRQVTVADLRSEDRFVTGNLAEQMAEPRLHDGSCAIGLRYGSKHGSDWDCWTVWLRDSVHNAIAVDAGQPVLHPDQNPVLMKVLDTYGLSTG